MKVRPLRLWEIGLFVLAWQVANTSVASAAGSAALLLTGSAFTALLVFMIALLADPTRRWERSSWEKAKRSHNPYELDT